MSTRKKVKTLPFSVCSQSGPPKSFGSGWVNSGRVDSGRVRLGQDQVGSGRFGSGQVGSGSGWVGYHTYHVANGQYIGVATFFWNPG